MSHAIRHLDYHCSVSEHAVRYRQGRKIYWLVKCEWHC